MVMAGHGKQAVAGVLALLAETSIFGSLDRNSLEALAARGEMRRFPSGDWIVHHGDIWPYLFLIAAGEVSVIKESSAGRSLSLTSFGRGDIFWGLAFFIEKAPMPAALVASGDCELLLWHRPDVLPMFLKNGLLSWELSCLMIERVQLASVIVDKLAFQAGAGRLARLLLEFSSQESQGPIARSLTLDEMAARIGSTREMVSRFLHRFSDQGLIEITRTEFSVTDRKGLEDLAQQVKG